MEKDIKKALKHFLKNKSFNKEEVFSFKRKIAKELKINEPSNILLLRLYQESIESKTIKKNQKFEEILRKKKIRSLSGVVVVSVLTKPYPCPGKCIFCPQEKDIPKSYLSGEPAVERARKLKYHPYLQVEKRIEMLKNAGHPTDKIEIRIIGGSFSFYPEKYKTWFIKMCFNAANNYNQKSKTKNSIKKLKNKNLKELQKINETAKNRIVGISIETRPDLISKKEILKLRKLGITLVELGVQNVSDDILQKCKRGHGKEEIEKATKILKDSGFKVMYQMMLNLPGSTPKKDILCFQEIFNNQSFKPDWLKIYPCVVCEGTKLYQEWKNGKYTPFSEKKLVEILIKIKKIIPYYVRLARLFRDIPSNKIKAGTKTSNLREVVLKNMASKNEICKCIRCREVREDYNFKEKAYLFRENYDSSDGKDIFLSFENKNRTKIFSFLRLRIPSYLFKEKKHFIMQLKDSAIIREIHTYGQSVSFGKKGISPQHRGMGKSLIKEAEKISKKEFSLIKIASISGIGAREYWKICGYKLKGTYMVKKI